jgi:hypothetical protein
MIRKELALPAIVLKLENCDFGNFKVDVDRDGARKFFGRGPAKKKFNSSLKIFY